MVLGYVLHAATDGLLAGAAAAEQGMSRFVFLCDM